MGEMPLELRRQQIMTTYWVNLQGHNNHPAISAIEPCWEHGKRQINSFGWVVRKRASEMGIMERNYSPTVVLPTIPPWFLPQPEIDFSLLELMRDEYGGNYKIFNSYIRGNYYGYLQIYTDGSKDPKTGRAAAAVVIPEFNVECGKRITDDISVYACEMMAMIIALQWVEEVRPERVVIASDSCAALMSLKCCNSRSREDLLYEILQSLFRIHQIHLSVRFVWVPAHVGIDGNEKADKAAKCALKSGNKHININISKSEAKVVIKGQIKKMWQNQWNKETKGRYLFKNIPLVGKIGTGGRNRKEGKVITRIRNGHTGLNSSLYDWKA
ncbi:uncharacterized protein LOC107749259 [Sinocyclocheilus rhinocerous]|uniref:uncharacterized protein LOC107749259 n=1 Tax=Sinocyclocheilus rhinocerous TaxID=307959 RepID=UPI0007B871DA|nr:PREDICTED: uncharacterized protein LOC107749259 [Sinocyclocheilus rhinocerous]